MKHKLASITLAAVAFAITLPAAAQIIYRCGNSYSQEPCPGGSKVEAPLTPSTREQEAAREAARGDARTANAMEKARLTEEAKPVSVYIPPAKTEVMPDSVKTVVIKPTKQKAKKKPSHFTAVESSDIKVKKEAKK